MISRLARIALLALAAACTGAAASASIVTEGGGQFSRDWRSPTGIGFGADTVLGTAERQNGHEFLFFSSLGAGAQTLEFAFTAPAWALSSDSYSAGGQILWRTDAFRWAWDGTGAGSFQLGRWTPQQTLRLSFGDDFKGGPLYLGIYFTHGQDVSWSLSAPGNGAPPAVDAPAPVPLPAGLGPLGGRPLDSRGSGSGAAARRLIGAGCGRKSPGSPTKHALSRPPGQTAGPEPAIGSACTWAGRSAILASALVTGAVTRRPTPRRTGRLSSVAAPR